MGCVACVEKKKRGAAKDAGLAVGRLGGKESEMEISWIGDNSAYLVSHGE